MKDNDKKTVAIYTRVSTTIQVQQGHSLEEQEKRIKAICEAKGYEVYKVYTDEAISGKDVEHRPAYQKMIKDMKEKRFNLVMALKLDRLSRSITDFEDFIKLTEKYNCGVELIYGSIDTNGATGMMFARILATFAQFEREIIQERTLIGVESAVSKGHFGGKPPLGYMAEVVNGNKTKNWVINKEEAKIVKEIFDLCLKGKTYALISNIMNEKYPNLISCYRIDKKTNERKPIYRHWKDSSICVILNNKRYIGIHEHRKNSKDKETIEIIGKIPPIISEDIFNECQENIMRNSRNYYRNKNYLFMQKLKCPECGRMMACNGVRKNNYKDYLYYKCKDCNIFVREDWIENELIRDLNDLLELYFILGDNYYPIDNDMAEAFNNCKLNHRIRFAIDERIIKDHKNCNGYEELNELWKITSYEAKCKFICEFIDSIEIKRIKNKNTKNYEVEITNLKIKPSEMAKIFDLKDNHLFTEMLGDGKYKFSTSSFKNESEAWEYIDLLKMKYNITTEEFYWGERFNGNPDWFKVINIIPTKVIEKRKTICLYLAD